MPPLKRTMWARFPRRDRFRYFSSARNSAGDTWASTIALNLYLGYGSTVLRAGSREDLSGAAALEISSLFAEEKQR